MALQARQIANHPPALGPLVSAIESACLGPVDTLPTAVAQSLARHADPAALLTYLPWTSAATGYTRHLLHADSRGRFSLVALVWPPAQHSPIHGHYTWCAYHVLRGALHEEQYGVDPSDGSPVLLQAVVRPQGSWVGSHGGLEPIHRLGNHGTETAVSLHVYGIDGERVATHVNRWVEAPAMA